MRFSRMFTQTLREPPAEVDSVGMQLLLRAGYVRPAGNGYNYLPLGALALQRIEAVFRHELEEAGAVGVQLAVETGLTQMEKAAVAAAGAEIRSYRQIPARMLQVRDAVLEAGRGGLLGTRQARLLEMFSLDADETALEMSRGMIQAALERALDRLGLPVMRAVGDPGWPGGSASGLHVAGGEGGEEMLRCPDCGYAAAREMAAFRKAAPAAESPLPAEKVATPHASTIQELAAFLQIPETRTAKAVFLMASSPDAPEKEEFIFVVVRGDMEVSEAKLKQVLGAVALRPATDAEIRAVGAEPGYASPVGVKGVRVVADDLLPACANLVAGANEAGYHLLNTNLGRDYSASVLADIAAAHPGDGCPQCGGTLQAEHSMLIARLVERGTRISERVGAAYLDAGGVSRPAVSGMFSVNLSRVLLCLAERYHDERGLCFPREAAALPVHLVVLAGKVSSEPEETAALIEARLQAAGVEALIDDRGDSSAGVKFNDADLIGLPLRVTVSERSLKNGGVEVKERTAAEGRVMGIEELVEKAISNRSIGS